MKRANVVNVRDLLSGRARYRCGPARPGLPTSGFHWGPPQVAQLIVDLENAAQDSHDEEDVSEEHLYLGVVTVTPPRDGLYVIMDGQQRFIVLAMFLAFARDRMPTNRERNMLDRMLVRRAFGKQPEARLRLSPEDHAWFAHFILPPGATTRLPTTAPLGSPRELLLAARFMEHAFAGYSIEHLRSVVDFLLHHTAVVRSLGEQRATAPISAPAFAAREPAPERTPERPAWNDVVQHVPAVGYRVAAE